MASIDPTPRPAYVYDDTSGSWIQIVGLQGPVGATGPTGATSTVAGPTGPTGPPSTAGYTSTVTSETLVTLTSESTRRQAFTGSTPQNVNLPVASTLTVGDAFYVFNDSTATVTVRTSNGTTVLAQVPGTMVEYICILASGTTVASWEFGYNGFNGITGSGFAVLGTSPTLTSPTINAPILINTGTLTLPTSTDTLVGRATTDTLTNKTLTTPVIDSISGSSSSVSATLYSGIFGGSIAIGSAVTSGSISIANASTFVGTLNLGSGLGGTGSRTINLGTGAGTGTTTVTIGSGSGATSNITINGTTAIGNSVNKTTAYPALASGTTTGTVTTSAQMAGFLGTPINARGSAGVALAYTLVSTDAGRMIYVSSTPTTPTITIPANSSVAFEIGTTIAIANDVGDATNLSITINTDTLQLAGTGDVGTRTLARYGVATLIKVTATKWIISGNGLT